MTFEEIKNRFEDRKPAFDATWPAPQPKELDALVEKYQCKYPNSFVAFQLYHCTEVPMGDLAFEGFGFANKQLEPYMNLEEILNDYHGLGFPANLTPFKQVNGDFWCFDNRMATDEYPVVVFDHHTRAIVPDTSHRWENFLDWLVQTMEEE